MATLGGCAGSEEIFLAMRGLRTLDVRLGRLQQNAIDLVHYLNAHHGSTCHASALEDARAIRYGSATSKVQWSFLNCLKPALSRRFPLSERFKAFREGIHSWGSYESLIIPFDCTNNRTAPNGRVKDRPCEFMLALNLSMT